MAEGTRAARNPEGRSAGSADAFPGMPDLTDSQRKAVKEAMLKFKRFWNTNPGSVREDEYADTLIDAFVAMARELSR